MTDLAQDNVDLNFDAVYKLALQDDEAAVRAAALRGLVEYEGRDLIPTLVELLREDTDPDVRREAAIALGRYALASELGHLGAKRNAAIRRGANRERRGHRRGRARARPRHRGAGRAQRRGDRQPDREHLRRGQHLAQGRRRRRDGPQRNECWLPIVLREMENRAPEMRHAAAFAAGEIGEDEAVPPPAAHGDRRPGP